MKVIIVNNSKTKVRSPDVQKLVNRICTYFIKRRIRNKAHFNRKKEITVVFVNSVEMQKINRQFRQKNKPTDVLSFASSDPDSLGELLLCPEILKKQALRQKHPYKDELAYMLIHGLLHLQGYDHERSQQEEKLMFRLQENCFRELVR